MPMNKFGNSNLSPFYKNIIMWLVIFFVFFSLFNIFSRQQMQREILSFSRFLEAVEAGEVAEVVIRGNEIVGKDLDGREFDTYVPNDYPGYLGVLRENHVAIVAKPIDEHPWIGTLVSWFLPIIILVAVWVFFMRQMQMGGGKAMSFGKSKAKLLTEEQQKVTFDDVAGVDEAKEELEEIILFLKDPKKYTKLGGRLPRGVLLVGPPGTGKTLLARAIAGEAGVPFFSISGSDFVEMFVGVGASRVRDLFIQGKKNAPCILFIDEIDAVGRHRGAGLGGGHDEREQTLNQLLVEMDGFESNEGVILISATNRPDVLDPALMRPGRFDRQVVVPRPDIKGREGILKVHTLKTPLAKDVVLEVIARGTPGFSGADIANLVNEAALLAARWGKETVEMADFEYAKDKVLMGTERKSMIISDEEKKITAYHEAGHALVAKFVKGADPVHKVTIIPRGMALGVTQLLPAEDKHNYSKTYLNAILAVKFGGRISEELIFDEMTIGAGNDLETATKIARRMVCEWGMSANLGPITYGKREEMIFLGREMAQHQDYSEDTAVSIDAEVKAILMESYDKARSIIEEHMEKLHHLANALLERESLDAEQVDLIIKGEELPGPEPVRESETAKKEAKAVDDAASPGEGKPKAVKPRKEPAMSLKGQEEPSS